MRRVGSLIFCYVLSSNERRLELLVSKGFYSIGLSCSLRPLTQVILKMGKTTSNCSYLYTKRRAKYKAVHNCAHGVHKV